MAAPAPAPAGILTPDDAAELAQSLAEAQEEQGICYGWSVDNNFSATHDVGSSTDGPGRPLTRQPLSACTKGFVELEGDIDYACDSCESEDSASVSIDSSLPNPPTVQDLEALGLKAGALTGDKDDTTLVNMVNALPLLAADRGNATYVAYEPAADVPATDHATDKPGSDLLRDSWIWLVLFGALILGGAGLYLYKRAQKQT
ncbi:MAG: LPXTG cell wall anchor domain-containing protein [Actinomycetota bacterium]|nr:LPXTG cell wall anchor domain-containing protein [Actinomycetota bacterium]